MLIKYFVALTFKNDTTLSRKVDGFKRRFDPKYNSHSFPHMSLLAPFVMDHSCESTLADMLSEELSTFFYGHEGAMKLSFTGLDIQTQKNKNYLFLNPHYDADLEHCVELVQSICESFIPKSIHYKQNKKQLLPIGRFNDASLLASVMEELKEQFSQMSELKVDSIVLMKKTHGMWQRRQQLISFEDHFDELVRSHSMAV